MRCHPLHLLQVNYVQTTNDTGDAPERIEWFITSGSRDGTIYPETTPCAASLNATQASTYVQASIKMQSELLTDNFSATNNVK